MNFVPLAPMPDLTPHTTAGSGVIRFSTGVAHLSGGDGARHVALGAGNDAVQYLPDGGRAILVVNVKLLEVLASPQSPANAPPLPSVLQTCVTG